ncbi:MAG: RNA-binding protein, partial [Desulfobulbaceae bacterium]|nr:RNA-binding protein [Desulfobulbaceae bacterium]
MKLYVGNLSHAMTEKELVKLFSSYGDVTGVNIIKDYHTRQSKNFGYLELSQEDG